jgi:osmotically-inducible protein OsmY
LGVFVPAVLAFTMAGCRVAAAGADQRDLTVPEVHAPLSNATPGNVESDLERTIRVQLDKSFSDDPSLREGDISVSVDNGDVTLTGNVWSEAERKRTNYLAMDVPGVRSVANALRVSEEEDDEDR